MKKLFLKTLVLISFLSLTIYSCKNYEKEEIVEEFALSNEPDNEIVSTAVLNSNNLFVIDNFALTFEESEEIQNSIIKDLKRTNENFKDIVISINKTTLLKTKLGRYLLRTEFNNGSVSTTSLTPNSKGARVNLEAAKVTCTSTSCASGGGCIPDFAGVYCTKCTAGTKDCERSTSNSVSE